MTPTSQCTISVASNCATRDLYCGTLATPAFSEVPPFEMFGASNTKKRYSPETREWHRGRDRLHLSSWCPAPPKVPCAWHPVTVQRMADALRVPAAYLFGGDNQQARLVLAFDALTAKAQERIVSEVEREARR